MGKAAKQIIDGLKKAKVSADAQKRVKDLIDEAHDWDAAQAAEVEAVVQYVCGAAPELPKKITKDFVEHRASELLHSLSKGRKLDAWDLRALDVLACGRGMYWGWELDSWLRDRVAKFPKEPIFEEGRELFRARGLWKTDDDILASMFDMLTAHVTGEGALTSTGRFMLEKLDADAAGVLAIARSNKKEDNTSNIYDLLIAHRRKQFDALVPKLVLKKDSDKSYLAQVMLDADAKGYEKQAVALMRGLKDPIPALYSAKNLEKHFKGKYLPLVKELLVAAVKAKSASFIWEDDADGSREVAIRLAWPMLKDDALDVWRAYDEENDALRVDMCATIEKQAKKKALPWLIDALVYPKDPNVEYGFMNHAKYVAALLKISKPYDLKPHRERIEKAFAKNKNKKIRELIDPIIGGAKAPKAAKTKAAPAKTFDGKKGYRFDAYADSVVKAALAAIQKNKKSLPSPIENVKLAGFQGEIQLNALVLEGVGEPVTFELDVPKTRVPGHCDFIEDDLLEKFGARHGLEEDEIPSWGDMFKLPWCALLHEQIGAAQAIAAGLKKHGTVAKKCKVGVGEDDNFWDSQASFARKSREEIAALPSDQQADFAAICFEDPKKQRWLVKG
jgi:hypothetical protein